MNTKNNLQKALKGAFENHEVPLNEAQWTRLEGALIVKKRRWIFPFFLSLIFVGLISGLLFIVALKPVKEISSITKQQFNKNSVESTSTQNNNKLTKAEPHSVLISNLTTQPTYKSSNPTIKSNSKSPSIAPQTNSQIEVVEGIENVDNTSESNKEVLKDINVVQGDSEGKLKEEIANENKTNPKPNEVLLANNDSILIPAYNPKDIIDDLPMKVASKFAFSLAGGYSNMNVKIKSIENAGAIHKDTRQIFEDANKNLNTEFFTFGFDWKALPRIRLGVSSGFQYLRVASTVNINYKLTEVPFWNSNRTHIDGYIEVDPKTALELNSNTTNYTTYIIIPLKVNYAIPINSKNEILLSGGTNLTTLAAAKGQNININNEPKVNSLNKSMFRKLNAGWAGGFQYCSKLNKQWWIGLDNTWQTNPLKYKIGEASIKNKLQGYSVNLIIKYKI